MANLTISVNEVDGNTVVSGTALGPVEITVNGVVKPPDLIPNMSGNYSRIFPGTGLSISAKSNGKIAEIVVDDAIQELDTGFDLTSLERVKARRIEEDKIELSGKFDDDFAQPATVTCTRKSTGQVKTGTVGTNKKWEVTFDNCPGKGHRFRVA